MWIYCYYMALRSCYNYIRFLQGRETNEVKWLIISTTVFVAKQQSFMLRHNDVDSANCLVQFSRSTTFPMSGPLTGEVHSKIADKVCINQGCSSYKQIPNCYHVWNFVHLLSLLLQGARRSISQKVGLLGFLVHLVNIFLTALIRLSSGMSDTRL
jgi:hypothetical protein